MEAGDTVVTKARQPAGDPQRLSVRREWPVLRPVLIFHLITRAVVLAGLVGASVFSGRSFPAVVTRWDGRWYHKLAVHGYPAHLPIHHSGRVAANTSGFFFLYPLLTKALMAVGVPFWLGGMLINLVASTAAVLIIVLVGLQYLDRQSAALMACLWTAFPMSAVLTTTYTEAVFVVFGASALLFMFRRRWLLAGLAAALAGAVRSPGIVFAGAVALGALEAIIRRREWRSLIGAAIAPLGFLGAVGYIGLQTGRMDAWQITERDAWHARLTFGRGWVSFLESSPTARHGLPHLMTAWMVIALLVLTVLTVVLRPPIPIIGLVVVGAFTAFAFGGVEMDAAPRVMMSFFPVLAPLAVWMARWPRVIRWIVLGLASVVASLFGAYYFAYAPISL